MNKPMKAVLLSALIYPGAGHFFLKKFKMCIVFVSVFSVPLFLVISEISNKTNQVVEQIQNGKIPFDIVAMTEALSNIISDTDAQALNVKMYVMIIVWVIAIFDTYRLGSGIGKAKTQN